MTSSAASRQFGQAIALTIRFQLGLVLVVWALFVAGRVGATATGLLGVLFAIVATGTVVLVAAFVIRTTVTHGK